MSVKELVVLPKPKFDSLTNAKEGTKDTRSVSCQTESSKSLLEMSKEEDEHRMHASSSDSDIPSKEMSQQIQDGAPGKLYRRPRQNRRRTRFYFPHFFCCVRLI